MNKIALRKGDDYDNITLCNGKEEFFKERGYTILDDKDINKIFDLLKSEYDDCSIEICKPLDPKEVVMNICQLTHADYNKVMSSCRDRECVFTRHLAMYVFRYTKYGSLQRIGELFKKDHATVLHALKNIECVISNTNDMYYGEAKAILQEYGLWTDKFSKKIIINRFLSR